MVNVSGSHEHALSSALAAGGALPERRLGLIDRRSCPSGGRPGRAEANHVSTRFWKVRDVAEFLQASESWVRHAAAGGRLPCTKIGGLLRFDPDEIRSLARADAPARVLPRKR
jgi:predicted DNA-binding transcriptional regulator AlpA